MSGAEPPQGLRMPAEWEPHAATWIAWPHCEETWPGMLDRVASSFAQMVKALVEGEDVHILVTGVEIESLARAELRRAAADSPRVHFHHLPHEDAWIRDFGPIFVKRGAETVVLDWAFNTWGGKYGAWDGCDAAPRQIARLLGLPCISPGMVLEGGSIDVNSGGHLLTTEQCLLNPNRNPNLARGEIERRLRDHLGAGEIHWLGEGIEGDDTDGHIDDIARFVSETTIVAVAEGDESDANFDALREDRERLDALPFEVVALPPPPRVEHQGVRLPASHANFLIGNAAVLLPTFGDERRDEEAAGVLRDLFPDRRVIGIPSRELVAGLGAVHCLTMQQPE